MRSAKGDMPRVRTHRTAGRRQGSNAGRRLSLEAKGDESDCVLRNLGGDWAAEVVELVCLPIGRRRALVR